MINSSIGRWMLTFVLAVLPLAIASSGCEMFGGDDDDDNSADTRVSSKSGLPSGVDRVMQGGRGENVNWTAKDDGTVYVMDRDSEKVIYTGSIRSGHRLEVNPSSGQVMNNGVIVNRDAKDNARYNIYFLPS